jgi:hypothetical protein
LCNTLYYSLPPFPSLARPPLSFLYRYSSPSMLLPSPLLFDIGY